MEKVTRILDRKQPHFKAISPQCSINDAMCRMNYENTDHLIVMDDNEKFLGVVTEHDIATKSLFSKTPAAQRVVRDIMSTNLPIAFVNDTVDECMQCMQHYRVRLLPVFEGHTFKGIVTTEDILYEAVWNRTEIFDADKLEVTPGY